MNNLNKGVFVNFLPGLYMLIQKKNIYAWFCRKSSCRRHLGIKWRIPWNHSMHFPTNAVAKACSESWPKMASCSSCDCCTWSGRTSANSLFSWLFHTEKALSQMFKNSEYAGGCRTTWCPGIVASAARLWQLTLFNKYVSWTLSSAITEFSSIKGLNCSMLVPLLWIIWWITPRWFDTAKWNWNEISF